MFEILEKSFELCDAELLNMAKNNEKEALKEIDNYVIMCESHIEQILQDINAMTDTNNKQNITLELFEKAYEERILYRVDDISAEMYMLQNFLLQSFDENNDTIKGILQDIDGVEALLMLVPEEIEKMKCVKIALENC